MLAQHQILLKQQQVQLRTYAWQVAGYEREIKRLKAQLDKLKRMLFGQSSEKEKPTSPRLPSSRKLLPVELPRETVRIEPRETVCPVCRGKLAVLGDTVTEQLDIINNTFKVIETIRLKLACRKCDSIVQAPLLAKPIYRSYASPGLLSRILVSQYVEHIPLYRQCEIYARHGLVLSRNTLVRLGVSPGQQTESAGYGHKPLCA